MTMAMAITIPVAQTHLRALPGQPPFPRRIRCVPQVQFLGRVGARVRVGVVIRVRVQDKGKGWG